MSQRAHVSDLELAGLVSSKICHDVIGSVSAIYNGLEILGEDDDADTKSHALDIIRSVTQQASARLQFARIAFGTGGTTEATVDLETVEKIVRGLIGRGRHILHWHIAPGRLDRDRVRLLLNLIASAVTALPRGGALDVGMSGAEERIAFLVRCRGPGARPPQYLAEFASGEMPPLDAMTIQAYYT
ncbi:MAG: histidine phosphotransferase family protein, partial [Hyphomicrobiaceae bacterium]